MNLLLDTHTLLWFILDDPRLSANAKETVISTDGPVFISPASFWETAIKISLGKYALPVPFKDFWEEQLTANDFSLLPISMAHCARVAILPFYHRDPFDRLIIAQALADDIAIVGKDNMFDSYGVKRIW
ncbi:MAG: type II toxin-antitoxin system VapC family toxin [Deltaproteobacteria bacterium]|nr:type II toxin-antitoxin system VapC family toxin [Deltaproteobacteria bacterium]